MNVQANIGTQTINERAPQFLVPTTDRVAAYAAARPLRDRLRADRSIVPILSAHAHSYSFVIPEEVHGSKLERIRWTDVCHDARTTIPWILSYSPVMRPARPWRIESYQFDRYADYSSLESAVEAYRRLRAIGGK